VHKTLADPDSPIGATLLPFPCPILPFPFPLPSLPLSPSLSLPLEVGPLNTAKRVWGSAVSSPSGVWGGAPVEIEVGAF